MHDLLAPPPTSTATPGLPRREFLRRVGIATLVGATVGLGHRLGVDAAGEGISMVGDSLTAGTQSLLVPAFVAAGWSSAHVSAYGGRGIRTKMSADPFTGVGAVDDLRASHGDTAAWVIALGTNDCRGFDSSRHRELILQMMGHLGDGHRVLWVDVAFETADSRARTWNATLAEVAAARDDMFVLPWSATIASHPEWYTSDGVHHTAAGARSRVASVTAGSTVLLPVATRSERVATSVASIQLLAQGTRFTPGVRRRVVDTRVTADPIEPGMWRRIDLSGHVPAGAAVAAVNLTVVDPTTDGFLSVVESLTDDLPTVSTVNARAGVTLAAGTVAPLVDGACWVFSSCHTDLLLDVHGWYGTDGGLGLRTATPVRLFDSRTGAGAFTAGQRLTLTVPATSAGTPRAALVHLTAVEPAGAGFVSIDTDARGDGAATPSTSDLNVSPTAGSVSNCTHVELSDDGRFTVVVMATTHLLVDVVAVFDDGDDTLTYAPVRPMRVLDTRTGTGGWRGAVATGQSLMVGVDDAASVVVGTLTATRSQRSGWLAVRSADADAGGTSVLNPSTSRVVSSPFTSAVGNGGHLVVDQGDGGGEHLVMDLVGVWM